MLIDSHCHITDEKYGDGGRAIMADMASDGLDALVCVGCDMISSRAAIEVAHESSRVFAAVGVHPYYPEQVTAGALDELRDMAKDKKVVAIGEIGLDYHLDGSDRAAQIRAMIDQYELARELHLPMIFHVRDAAGDFTDFLRGMDFPESGVMHCFSGSPETAELCLSKGLYISFSGKLTYRNSKRLREVAETVPEDKMLIETDAPYLSPAERFGQTNYPKYVAYVRDKLAELRGLEPDRVGEITAKNTQRLFFKMAGATAQ